MVLAEEAVLGVPHESHGEEVKDVVAATEARLAIGDVKPMQL